MARGISVVLIVDPKKAIEGLDKVTDKADSTSNAMAGMGKALGGIAIAGAAAIAAGVAGLAAASVSASKYADDILTAATNTRLSTDTLQAYKYAAELIDTPLDTMTASLAKNIKAMEAARTGSGAQADAYAALGVQVTDGNGALRDSNQVYWETIDALGRMQNETERDALAQIVLGKSAQDLNSLIAQGSAGFAALTDEAKKNGAVMSGEQLAALGGLNDQLERVSASAEAAKNAIGLILMPQLTLLGSSGSDLIGQFAAALVQADGDVSAFGPAAGQLISGFADTISEVIGQALPIVLSLVDGLVAQLPTLVQTGVDLLVSLVTGIAQALPTLIPNVVRSIVAGILTLVSPQNLNAILNAGLGLLTGLIKGLITALPILIAALPQIILSIVDFVLGAIPQLIDAGIQLLLALVGALPEIIAGIVQAIPKIIVGIVTALVEAIPQIIEAGIQLLIALVTNLPTIIFEIVKAIPEIITGIVNAFTDPDTLKRLGDAGMELIRGLWEGISSMGEWLWGKIEDFATGITDWWNGLWGIHSPSTVFAGIGRYAVAGLEQGLSAPNRLRSIMSGLSDQVSLDASLSVGSSRARAMLIGSPSAAASSTQVTQQITQQFYLRPEDDMRLVGRQAGREVMRELAGVSL